jgi:hypothetical protein
VHTAVLSIRDERPVPWFGCQVDAEDALASALGAAVHRVRATARPYTSGPLSSGHARRVVSWTRALHPVRIEPDPRFGPGRADVLLVLLNDLHDASLLLSVPRWHEMGEVVLVHIAEVNERERRLYRDVVGHLRRRVDHLFVSVPGPWLQHLPGGRMRTAAQVPVPLDVLAFAPRCTPERAIDVFNPGRRHPTQHAVLRNWAERHDRFYLHDTGYLARVHSLAEHRTQYRSLASRSRVFVTNYAAVAAPTRRTFPAPAIGSRFYEAMAAGCVLAGDVPTGTGRDAEIVPAEPVHWPVDAPALPAELAAVLDTPEELGRRSAAARATALSVADVAHRWTEMAARADLPEHPGITARLAGLRAAAEQVRGTTGTSCVEHSGRTP